MKTTKLLLGLALSAGVLAVAACGNPSSSEPQQPSEPSSQAPTTSEQAPSSSEKEEVPVVTPVAEFKGAATIEGTEYKVVCALFEDKTLELKAGDVKSWKGSYEFVEGKGYSLTIGNSEVETEWDAEAKAHKFTYELKLGDAGSGSVTLSLADEDFVLTAKSPKIEHIESIELDGVLNAFGQHNLHLRFKEDGTYAITTDTEMAMVKGMLEKSGTYTYANNVFTLSIDGTEYKSVYNLHTGAYEFSYNIKGQDGTFPVTLTYTPEFVLTGTAADFGGLTFDLYTYSDGTCFADITTTMESMNAMFDREGTWSVVEGNYVYAIKTNPAADAVEFAATVNPATGLMEVAYEITGDRTVKATLVGAPVKFNGTVSNLGGVNFDLVFTSDTACFIDVTTTMEVMNTMFDKAGTYVVEDGAIKVTIGEETFTSTFDEETGSYKLTYKLVGPEYTLTPELVSEGLWA